MKWAAYCLMDDKWRIPRTFREREQMSVRGRGEVDRLLFDG